jgi:hypothetical protein
MKLSLIYVFFVLLACKPRDPNAESDTRDSSYKNTLPIVKGSAPFALPPLTSRATALHRRNGYRNSPLGLKVNWRAEPREIKDREEVPFTHFVVHHTAKVWIPPSNTQSLESWENLCRDSFLDIIDSQIKPPQSFDDIAYHFAICPTGEVFEGRLGKNVVGAGAWGQNQGAIAIVLMGQYSPDPKDQKEYGFNSKLPEGQLEALARLIAWLSSETNINIENSRGDFLYNTFTYKKLLESNISFKRLPDATNTLVDSPSLEELKTLAPSILQTKNTPKVRATTRPVSFITQHQELAGLVPQGFCMKSDCGTYPDACPGKLVINELPRVLTQAVRYKKELYSQQIR